MHDFHAITVVQNSAGVRAARHDGFVDFDSNALVRQSLLLDQLRDGGGFWHGNVRAVQDNLHDLLPFESSVDQTAPRQQPERTANRCNGAEPAHTAQAQSVQTATEQDDARQKQPAARGE